MLATSPRASLCVVVAAVGLWLQLRPAAASEISVTGLEGRPLAGVEVRSDTPSMPIDELALFVVLEIGQPFKFDQLSRSLRNLQASGLVSEVEVFVEETIEGVVLTFALWGRIQVESISFEGELHFKSRQLGDIISMGVAEPFLESRVLRSKYDLEAFYESRGYLNVVVRPRPIVDEVHKTARVVFQIEPGPQFEVRTVDFTGDLGPLAFEDLIAHLKMGPGKPYGQRAARVDKERLETWLIDSEFRLARLEDPAADIDWDSGLVDLVYPVEVGPKFHIEIVGGDRRRLRKRGLLPFLDSRRYDEAVLMQSEARVRRYYQELGFYAVEVETSDTRTDEVVHLVMTIEPGEIFSLTAVEFVGNQEIADHQLVPLTATSTGGFMTSSGRLVDEVLREDLLNIESFYRLQGYWDAVVGPPEIEKTLQSGSGTRNELSVLIPIEEGAQRRLVDLTLEGVERIDEAALRTSVPLQPGGPFHPRLLDRTLDSIRAQYDAQGFESTQVSSKIDWDEAELLADVEILILEGPQSVVDRVVLRGNRRTRSGAIRRAANLSSGDSFNSNRLLQTQRNLYGLAAFSRVDVRRAPGVPFAGQRDIIVEVEEGSRHKVSYGVGYDSEDGVRGLFGYTRSNILGRGMSSRFDLKLSQRDSLVRLLAHQPFVGRFRLPITGSLFYIESTEESFLSRRRGGQVEAERIGDTARVSLLYEYRKVESRPRSDLLEEFEDIDEEIDRDLQDVEISSLTPGYRVDFRNDAVEPTSGWSASIQVEYAFPFLGAEEEFLDTFLNYTQYLNVGRFGSFAGSLRIGAIEPLVSAGDVEISGTEGLGTRQVPIGFDGCNEVVCQPSQLIPISERYFAGGRSTHRAYRRDLLGIPGETLLRERADPADPDSEVIGLIPVGGNGQLLFNLDYRFPVAGPVGGVVFVDWGNVFGDWQNINFGQLKEGVGVGVRYLSPVGPIRVEVGWKLDREPTEDPYVVFLSFGNAF